MSSKGELRTQFFLQLQKMSSNYNVNFIFSFSGSEQKESAAHLLPFLIKFDFPWVQLNAHENNESTIELIEEFKAFQFFKIILCGGVFNPADYEKFRGLQVEVIALDKALFDAGPGLPKRLNQSEEFFRPNNVVQDLQSRPATRMSWFWCFLLGVGMFIGSIMALVIAKTNVIFAYDVALSGISKTQIAQFNERLLHFMSHDCATLSGAMFSIGVLYMSFSWFGARR